MDLEIDWRKMLGQNQLNDKQRDAANKIRLKEAKLERCRGEADRLRKKDRDSADGLRCVERGGVGAARERVGRTRARERIRHQAHICLPALVLTPVMHASAHLSRQTTRPPPRIHPVLTTVPCSAGQAQALRNLEIKAEKLEEEIGEMEEELEEALRESVMAKKGLSQGKRSALERQRGARRRARGGDGSDGEGSDDDDDNLLDLTKRGKKARGPLCCVTCDHASLRASHLCVTSFPLHLATSPLLLFSLC